MFLISSCSCLCPVQWSQVLSREWRCSWSSADRRCSNYIWLIDNFITYSGATYIRDLVVNHADVPTPCLASTLRWALIIYADQTPNMHQAISNPWWRHQMETFFALLAHCKGNSPVTSEFPSQKPMTRSFHGFFDLLPNKRLCEPWRHRWFETPSRSLWRHCNAPCWLDYDFTVSRIILRNTNIMLQPLTNNVRATSRGQQPFDFLVIGAMTCIDYAI